MVKKLDKLIVLGEEKSEEEYYVKKAKEYEAGYMSNPSDEEDEEVNQNRKLSIQQNIVDEPKQICNKNNSFDNFSIVSVKNNRSKSRLKKPIKNLISFDEFLCSS